MGERDRLLFGAKDDAPVDAVEEDDDHGNQVSPRHYDDSVSKGRARTRAHLVPPHRQGIVECHLVEENTVK